MKKKHLNVFLLIFAIAFMISCKGEVNNNLNFKAKENNLKYVELDSLMFDIDSLSLPYSNSLQFFDDSAHKYFTYFNSTNNSIYFFDIETKKISFIWKSLEDENIYDSHFIINKDSIFLFNLKTKTIFLLNISGECKGKFIVSEEEMIVDSAILPFSYLQTNLPLVNYNNFIYFTGYHVGEFDKNLLRKTVHKLNLKNNKSEYLINFPELYNKYHWGTTYFYTTSSTYNPKTKSLIINFPISHSLYVYNLVTEEIRCPYAGSNDIKSIKPFSKNKDDITDANTRLKYYLENASYESIYYDIYKNIYYRIAALPINYTPNSNIHDIWKQRMYKLIILDENFNYIGETYVDNIIPTHVFVSNKGVHIQTFSHDNIMKFKIYNIII